MLVEVAAERRGASRKSQDVRVRIPLAPNIEARVLYVVLDRLGVSANLVPGFRAMYVGYWNVIIAGLAAGPELEAAVAQAKRRRDRKVIITIRVGAPLLEAVATYLASIDRTPPEPKPRSDSDGGGVGPRNATPGDGFIGDPQSRQRPTGRYDPSPATDVFGRVYETAQAQLKQLVGALETVLYAFGCGDSSGAGRLKFETELRKVLVRIYGQGVPGLRVTGTTDPRRAMLRAVVLGFGGDDRLVDSIAYHASRLSADDLARSTPPDEGDRRSANAFFVDVHVSALHSRGVQLRGRLLSLMADLSAPYRRSGGATQACDLLAKFPDVATPVYDAAGLQGLASFPPVAVGPLNEDAATFKRAAEAWSTSASRWKWIEIGGLIVAGIAITAISAGTLGPLGATLVGAGIGLATGGYEVYAANNNLRLQMDAVAFGGASPERVAFAEGEVQGAYAGLLVNVVTMGALARFGGTGATPALSRLIRVTTISGAGGGLTVAVQPNVWDQPNVGGMILWGTLLGAGLGAAGTTIGMVGQRLLRVGAPVQIAIPRGQGVPKPGKTLLIQLAPTDKPVPAVVTAMTEDTITLAVQGTKLQVRVARAATIESNLFDPKVERQAIRPVRREDLVRPRVEAYVERQGVLRRGTATRRGDGRVDFVDETGVRTAENPTAIRIYDARKHAKIAGVSPEDLEAFRGVSDTYSIHKVPKTPGVFLAIPKTKDGRLALIVGPTHDKKQVFKGWSDQRLPKIDMRGKGDVPDGDEIALFGAHGNPFQFGGVSTKNAGRILADAIVTLNELQVGRRGPIRAVELSSCMQGMRRFLVLGKTNAEAMQGHVDQRLTELGYQGQHRITILAADRMGSLYGVDEVKVAGKKVPTVFVPAGKQGPLAYPLDLAQTTLKLVGVVLATGTAMTAASGAIVLGIAAVAAPDELRAWLLNNRDRVIGWIFDEAEP